MGSSVLAMVTMEEKKSVREEGGEGVAGREDHASGSEGAAMGEMGFGR